MNLLIIMPDLYHGGAETQMRNLACEMRKRGHDVTLLLSSLHGTRAKSQEQEEFERRFANRIVRLNGPKVNGWFTRQLRRRELCSLAVSTILKRQIDACLVYDFVALHVAPQLSRYTRVVFSERNEGNYSRFALVRNRRFFRSLNAVTCNSTIAQDNYSKHGIEATLIENGVQAERYPLSERSDFYRVLIPARVCPMKNQRVVFEADGVLPPSLKVEYRFAGTVEDEDYYGALLDLSRNIRPTSKVEFLGFVSNMSVEYKTCDAVILPSLSEGTPNVVLESIFHGRPVLASAIPQNENILDAAWQFNPGSARDLATKLIRLAGAHREHVCQIVDQNASRLSGRYTVEKMAHEFETLFLQVIGENSESK